MITSIESVYSSTSEKNEMEIALSGKLNIPLSGGEKNTTAEEEVEEIEGGEELPEVEESVDEDVVCGNQLRHVS